MIHVKLIFNQQINLDVCQMKTIRVLRHQALIDVVANY
jgi:hypothetical protein